MKNSLLLNTIKASIAMFLCLLFSQASFGQILFSEDFDGVSGPTGGGAGTYSFPSGWTLVNVDNRTPAGAVSYVNEAWERREDFANNVADSAAFSTSWYSPVGAADDWMWTPPIILTGSNINLTWNALTYDPLYPDGYEVWIMVDPTVPTGTTGSLGNMVSGSTLLYSIAAENTAWINRSVSLSSYAGQTVRIAFRNNSNDEFLLLIDDVTVENLCTSPTVTCGGPLVVGTDAGICSATISNAQLLAQIVSSGGDPVPTITFSPAAGTFAIGTTSVTATASNGCSPDATCSFDVTVEDNENPTIDCNVSPGATAIVTSTNVPVAIPDNPAVISTLTFPAGSIITDVNVLNLEGTHTWVGDLEISLTSPLGTVVTIMNNPTTGGNCAQDNFDVNFDDAGAAHGTIACSTPWGGNATYQPFQALSAFDGENPAGVWTLTIDDQAGGDVGSLSAWSLEITSAPSNTVTVSNDAGVCEAAVTVPAPAFNDNCPGSTIVNDYNNSSDASDIYPVGATTVTWTVTDAAGNASTCSIDVVVNDTEVPTIACGLVIPPVCGTTASTDVPVAIADVATVTSTLTVSGANPSIGDVNVLGLTGTHTWVSDLTVSLTSPGGTTIQLFSATCGNGDNFDINFDDAGLANGSWPCTTPIGGGGTYQPDQTLSAFNGEDPNGIWTLSVTDGAGGDVGFVNSWSLEICSPAIDLTQYTASNDPGQCGANVTIPAPTSSDNCSLVLTNDYNGTSDASDFYPIGTTTVEWTVTDPSGNTASCDITVVVTDDESPVITCPGDIAANNDLGQCGAIVNYADPVATDNCPLPAIVAFSDNSGLTIPDGDPLGASAQQTVSVLGTQLGVDVFLQSVCLDVTHAWVGDVIISIQSPDGTIIPLVDQPGAPASTWGCDGDDIDACFEPGTGNDVENVCNLTVPTISGTYTAANGMDLDAINNGGPASGTWTLLVSDAATPDEGTVNNWTLTFLDVNGTPAPIQTAGLPSGSEFPVGTTTNTFEVTDDAGNTASCSFDVIVSDTEAPVIASCPSDVATDNDAGACGAVVSYAAPLGGGSIEQIGNNFENGRASNTAFPNICADDFTLTSSGGACYDFTTVSANFFTNSLGALSSVNINIYADGGGMPGSIISSLVLTPSDWTATPVGSNFGFTIYDFDFTLPTPINLCGSPGGSTYWLAIQGNGVAAGQFYWEFSTTQPYGNNGMLDDGTGWVTLGDNYVFTFSTDAPTVSDNCVGFVGVSQTDGTGYTAGDEFPIGTTYQEYTAEDQYGNTSVCSFNVTVNDVEAPEFTDCPSTIIACDSGPTVFATPTADDNCAVDTIIQIAGLPSGSDFPIGVTTNTFVAYDPAGNTDTCSFTVTVTANPVADFTYFPTCISEIIYFTSTATVDTSYGTSIVSYEWEFSDGSGTNLDVNPTHVYTVAGDYDVTLTVTTNWGCETSVTYTVTVHPTPVFTATAADALCNGDANGTITVDVTVGDDPIQYSIDGGPAQADSVFTGLSAGSYLISVTDANGCSVSGNVTVGEPAVLVAAVDSTLDVLCFGQASGAAAISATGGTAPYSYSIDGGASQPSGLFGGITGGDHVVTVTDANGCTATVTVTVAEAEEIVVNALSQPVLCNGDASGSIDVTATGGTGVYQYSADGGTTFQATGPFTGLAAGTYVVVVQDENGCTVSEGVVITEPAEALTATAEVQNVACMGDASGSVTVSASGGTGALQYSTDGQNWQSGNVFSGLAAGDYTITVQDANGCSTTVDVTVAEPAELLVADPQVTAVSCNGAGDGMIDVVTTGGDAPYEYSFNGGVTWQSSSSFTNLSPGTYTVLTRDANGCEVASIVVVTQPTVLTAAQTASTVTSCEGVDDGGFTVVASGGTGPYTYDYSGGSNDTGVFTDVVSGTHAVTVTDASGCTVSVEVVVGYTNPLPHAAFNWFASGSVVQFSNQSTNGTSYSWDFGDGSTSTSQNPVHTYATGGSYTVTLVVTNACGSDTTTWTIDTNNIGIDDPDADGYVLNVYPNPNHGQFTLSYTGTGIIGQIQVNVMTVEGKLLMAEQFTVNADTFIRNYSDIELAAGIYIVQFISQTGSEVKRITVDK